MKKIISMAICAVMLAGLFVSLTAIAEPSEISVYLNGERLEFDVPPQIIDNRTMVPMRAIFEALGMEVEWVDDEDEISEAIDNLILFKALFESSIPEFFDWITYRPMIGALPMIGVFPNERNERLPYFVALQIGSYAMFVSNGFWPDLDERWIELDVPPQIVDNRALVPLRAISESLGADVEWDGDTRTVTITTTDTAIIYEEYQEITVSNAEEFVNALGSNRIIHVESGTYDFTPFNVTHPVFDYIAIGLTISNVRNLTIIGAEDGSTEFVNAHMFAEILTFEYCENITISNISAWHIPRDFECDAGVFSFHNSNNIIVNNCYLDGSGSVGISIWNSTGVQVNNTIITNCSLRGVGISSSNYISFYNVTITENRAYANAVWISDSDNVVFYNSEISNNNAIEWALFEVWNANLRIYDSIITNNSFEFAERPFPDVSLFKVREGGSIFVSDTVITNNTFAYETIGDVEFERCTFEDNVFDSLLISIDYSPLG